MRIKRGYHVFCRPAPSSLAAVIEWHNPAMQASRQTELLRARGLLLPLRQVPLEVQLLKLLTVVNIGKTAHKTLSIALLVGA